ncbi:uncharacterized protein LOC131256939 [Magnolia sinica]|uniref:uncharacterized protein LOC131256939 n=1 Tax=Magnolia sinica TaxID=86752 RepID=UPI002659FBCA|nr:uncharacterized protein LOC131256939 [Magnolia sinica]
MEFKFRAGENPPPSHFPPPSDGYFTAQALRAGYISSDLHLRRQEPLLLPHPMIPAREALRRELEKERIREEIIAREILRKRELEEEVRRELAMEREIELRRQADRFSLASASTHSERRAVGPALHHERFPGPSRREVGVVERILPVEREIRPLIPEVGKGQVVFLGKTTPTTPSIVGIKRKAATSSEPKDWSCALCQVSATSQQGLNDHLQGKKHKAKEEELRASKAGGRNRAVPPPKKVTKQPKPVKKGVATCNGPILKHVKKQKPQAVNQPVDQSMLKNHVGVLKKGRFTFLCEHCQIKCNSELMMVAHLGGKKHIARMQELEADGRGPTPAKMAPSKGPGKADVGTAEGGKKEMKIEGELVGVVKEEQGGERRPGVETSAALFYEAEVAEALTDDEEQAMEEQIDEEAEAIGRPGEEVASSCRAEVKEQQD